MAAHDWYVRANASRPPLPLLPETNATDNLHFKYLLNLDGHSYAHRLLKLLATNSLVIKEESLELEFYYHLLKPYVHYIPFAFKADVQRYTLEKIETNLTAVVRMAKRHDGEMRQIAEQAHALVHTHLCDAARRCYLYELLRRYGETMSYRPSPVDRPHAYRVTNRKHLMTVGSRYR